MIPIPARCAALTKARKSLRRTVSRARGEQAERLVAPGAAERVLGNGHEFDMREAEIGDIGDQPLHQRIPVQHAGMVTLRAQPRGGMHLVDRHGRIRRLTRRAIRHPRLIRPAEGKWLRHDRSRGRRHFRAPGQRIGLQRQGLPLAPHDLVFIALACLQARHEQFPDPGIVTAGAWGGAARPRN